MKIVDLGAFDGRASKHLVSEGDEWVLVDNGQYKKYDRWGEPGTPAGAVRVECDLMDYDEEADVVVCSNVIYHLENPIEAIKHLRKITRGKLILRTWVDKDGWWNKRAGRHSHAGTSETLWYYPTGEALIATLEEAGFTIDKSGSDIQGSVIMECH